ncbi:endo-1,4-beta-glucanase [Ephemerocybe angulata]|uniref:Endo-1,4-beta-glucanase n=1 Tax=Ephemerocybe angulata TaxID=980116 RepID=A0A8H6HVU4_9AGAR|nr:endo-1,4-beta-glucanase [Tulosesus angulatus]
MAKRNLKLFFDRFLEHFFQDEDAAFFKSLGLNAHVDDLNPRVLKESGFKHLDRVIDLVPSMLAKHYKGNKWVAAHRLVEFYNKVHKVIRAEDPDHIIFFDGNTFASDFSILDSHTNGTTLRTLSTTILYGFPKATEKYIGTAEQQARLKRKLPEEARMDGRERLCVWNGEWGPVYARRQYEGEATDEINAVRYKVLEDQLKLYDQDRLSWSIWLYKDIGFQGMTYVSLETKYMKLFEKFLAKKHRLAVDAWGADDTAVKEGNRNLYPAPVWKWEDRVARLARNILVSEYLVREWAEHFIGLSEDEIEEVARSFRFDNCLKRDGLNKV